VESLSIKQMCAVSKFEEM